MSKLAHIFGATVCSAVCSSIVTSVADTEGEPVGHKFFYKKN